ncbi:Up in starvation, partial [Elasticomyces elasticus]
MTMTDLRAVSTTLALPDLLPGRNGEETTPTTPRAGARFSDQVPKEMSAEESAPNTPTRYSFGGVPGQRPLPGAPYAPSQEPDEPTHSKGVLSRENSQRSIHSVRSSDSQDVEMGEDDDGQDESDNDSITSDSQRPSKKKKGQRFFCTEFPPCQLSFTRSEHLARHIRFSRLDNLRQHAQTVHVNEEIPGDSLAATGTRFQRQIRTDRVRPPNNRSRTSTIGSQAGPHSRGHSRNLSSSSITSVNSNVSMRDDGRRRPPPLAMASDGSARARLSLDTITQPDSSPGSQYGAFYDASPSGCSTPRSATFSTGTGSPMYQSGLQSPVSSLSRSAFYNGSRTPGRRLSVPSGQNPFGSSHGGYPPPYLSPMASSTASIFSTGSGGGVFASPSGSVFTGRRDSDAELEWRRRTWHPGTYSNYTNRPATSGLTYYQTPDDTRPAFSTQPAASQVTRLPGIESFDYVPPRPAQPAQPVRQHSSPMQIDNSGRPPVYAGPVESAASGPDNRRSHPGWEMGLHQNLTKLDITNSTPPKDTFVWVQQVGPPDQAQSLHPPTAPHASHAPPQNVAAAAAAAPRTQPSRDPRLMHDVQPITPRKNKRQAWYGGPVASHGTTRPINIAQRTSPDDNSSSSDGVPTPSTSQGTEYLPAIVHANGTIEMPPPGGGGGVVMGEEERQRQREHQKEMEKEKVSPVRHQPLIPSSFSSSFSFSSDNAPKPPPARADSGIQSYVHHHPHHQSPSAPAGPPTTTTTQGYIMQAGRDTRLGAAAAAAGTGVGLG